MKSKYLTWLLIALVFVAGCGGTGDRVLVSKCYYDATPWDPQRHDVVVFRFPEKPIQHGTPTNYIKRLIGLAGETIAIFFGQLFVTTALEYDDTKNLDENGKPVNKNDLWEPRFMHRNDVEAVELFKAGKFDIIRKPPATMLSMRRIVYNNDFQPKDLQDILPRRWKSGSGSGWSTEDGSKSFAHKGSGKEADWLHYQHILRPSDWPYTNDPNYDERVADIKARKHKPQLITDFSGYNSYELKGVVTQNGSRRWVGDLMVEFEVKVEKSQGEFWVELVKGVDRFQARWDLQTGTCTLVRLQQKKERGEKEGKLTEETLDSKPSNLKNPGTYTVRVANFDERLTVWVDRQLPFGDGCPYKRPWHYDDKTRQWVNTGPTELDLKPVSVASKGAAVQVKHLTLWRDTYYTNPDEVNHDNEDFWSDPTAWENMRSNPGLLTMYVQPGHYLCLGDNSPASYDGRSWGTVPERLLLGRALMVYWPSGRLGTIIH